jgi:EAL domain-containing protein (putative c-di-GMP-specific phosphodiesterase class I)
MAKHLEYYSAVMLAILKVDMWVESLVGNLVGKMVLKSVVRLAESLDMMTVEKSACQWVEQMEYTRVELKEMS